ncbi:MAG TPA: YggS family pyridoxal phosphate-dependent enzyme [Oscillospiraceae bacterium]|nr:YggS family pyridoxal phosphate-dependent enzyme [Oscillospiraceae bacterium]
MTEKSLNDKNFEYISDNIKRIKDEIASAAIKSKRSPEEVRLLAVTKTVEAEKINYAIEKCGIDLIGENKVQELLAKSDKLTETKFEKHFIGQLQRNKVRKIVPLVSMIQSVDSVRLANEISRVSKSLDKTSNILIEVNIGKEQSKAGFLVEELEESVHQISLLENISIQGLMCIPPICESETELNQYFENMYRIFIDIKAKKYDNIFMEILSMGMSGDYISAVMNGSNLVRIGSSIFGARTY